jgi:predicted RNA-binding Zn-ribbon protein involved in translation (DUF1610 family)
MDKVVNRYLAGKRLSRCDACGAVLTYKGLGKYHCEECGNTYLDDYGKIREYLDKHGPAPAVIISRDTGVDRSVVNALLYEGRIEIPEGSKQYLNCEMCGCSLKSGKICPKCASLIGADKDNYYVGEKPRFDNSNNRNNKIMGTLTGESGKHDSMHGRMHVRTGERLSGFSK